MSKLHFKYGAMNSGKSTALINTAYNYRETDKVVTVTKPSIDTKGERLIVARAGLSLEVDFLATPELDIRERVRQIGEAAKKVNCLIVDEAQFLQADQVDQLFELAKLDEISVIAYGLRTDFLRHTFPGSQRLMELADNLEKIPTMCATKGCNTQAEFNTRMVDGEFIFTGDQVAIDGEGEVQYKSLCGRCYLKEMGKLSLGNLS